MGINVKKLTKQFTADLFGLFRSQFGQAADINRLLGERLSAFLDPSFTGFLPTEEAALRGRAFETSVSRFDVARRQAQQRAFLQGGRTVPSGAQSVISAGIEAAEARDITRGQRDITLEGSRRRLGAQFQAAQLLSGVAQFPFQIGQLGLGGGSTLAQLQAASLGNAALGALGGASGGVLSALLAGGGAAPAPGAAAQ